MIVWFEIRLSSAFLALISYRASQKHFNVMSIEQIPANVHTWLLGCQIDGLDYEVMFSFWKGHKCNA